MAARRYTPEEAAEARVRKLAKQREHNRRRRSDPEYLARELAKSREVRRNWSPERRSQANLINKKSYNRRPPETVAKTATYMRNYALRTKYGLTREDWDLLFEKQGKACAICWSEEPKSKLGWSTDHSHEPPFEVRGILCHKCNIRLGQLGDNIEALRPKVLSYLNYLGRKTETTYTIETVRNYSIVKEVK